MPKFIPILPAAQWLEHQTGVHTQGMGLNLVKNSVSFSLSNVRDMLSTSYLFHDGAKSLPSLFPLDQSLK